MRGYWAPSDRNIYAPVDWLNGCLWPVLLIGAIAIVVKALIWIGH